MFLYQGYSIKAILILQLIRIDSFIYIGVVVGIQNYFHIESTFSSAFGSLFLSHIVCDAPSSEENILKIILNTYLQ